MTSRKLLLVHSADPSPTADEGRMRWWFENARQTGLFDDLDSIKILQTPLWEMNVHSFERTLAEYDPGLIIDTRQFPGFFSIRSTNKAALSNFKDRGIEYTSIPLDLESPETNQMNWKKIKSTLIDFRDTKMVNRVLFLTTTWFIYDQLLERINGYLSQETGQPIFKILSADIVRDDSPEICHPSPRRTAPAIYQIKK